MNKIEEIENNTKKILESGFIEAFIEHYVEIKDIDETENTRLMYLMCNGNKEKNDVTLKQINKTKAIIEDLGFSTLSFAFVHNMKRNLKFEKSNSWINRFADEFKDNIVNFQTVSYLFENTFNFKDERFTEEVKVALFQEHYEHDNYSKEKPLIKDVNILLEKEEELIEDILYLIEDYQKNEYWDIDILHFEHFRKYNTSIDTLFKLCELLFQLNQLSMYNEFLNYEKEEKIIKKGKKKYSEFERTLKGLNMIKDIFESQFKNASTSVLDSPLLHSNGRYLNGSFNIISNDETLSLSEFKNHYSKRYEKSKRNSLFINELKELRELAQQNLDFYNNELTENSKIVKEYHKNLPTEYVEKKAYLDEHSALVVLLNLNVSHIKFGKNLSWSEELKYSYLTNNKDLASICADVIQFMDKMQIEDKEVSLNKSQSKKFEDDFEINEINTSIEKKKIAVKFYVLTYILDCRANNEKIESKKNNLIIIGDELLKNETTKGITFYRVFNDYSNFIKNIIDDNSNNKKISTDFDLDWKDIVLQLSKNKDILHKYILDKKLV